MKNQLICIAFIMATATIAQADERVGAGKSTRPLDLTLPTYEYTQNNLGNGDGLQAIEISAPENYDEHTPLVLINLGNDILGIQSQKRDRYFSNNMNIAVVTQNVPDFFKKLVSQTPNTSYMVMAAHYFYTPENLSTTEVVKNDRPYAGWLFLRLQSTDKKHNHLIISGIQTGIVGPAAGAAQLQKWVHDLTGSTPPQGWDNQLRNELGVNIYQMRAVSLRRDYKYFDHELIGHAGVTLGNVNTHAQLGVLYRFGYNIPDDLGASFLNPDEMAMTGANDNSLRGNPNSVSASHENFTAYIFVGVDTRYVAQDIFLDGNTFQDSHSVEKDNSVHAFKTGIVVGRKGFEVGLANTRVSERFKGQNGPSQNGMVFIRYTKKFR